MKLVSIIVPIYKVEKYLKQCLDSIINQTYKNLEIILVDDGSPDNCGNICDEYAKNDIRIKVIHKENGGLSSARNAGLDIATGEYISFIDSDDYVAKDFIEKLYDLCEENDADIAECDFLKFEKNVSLGNEIDICIQAFNSIEMQKRLYSPEYVRTVVVWNKLYKRYLYESLRFPFGKINEDEFTTYKAFYNCHKKIVATNEKLYYYRYNSQSIMGSKFNKKRLDVLEALEERKKFYKDNSEKVLYEKTVVMYQYVLENFYELSKKNINDDGQTLKLIKKKLRNNIFEFIRIKEVSLKSAIKMIIFTISPSLYNFLLSIKTN